MIACVDVGYGAESAVAAGVLFHDFPDEAPVAEQSVFIDGVEPYVSGEFYRRELPCILALLAATNWSPSIIIIDGYVWLDEKPGLGAHLYDAIGGNVIGVAKTRFGNAGLHVLRGASKTPLYVTAAGMSVTEAAEHVRQMHGPSRIPTMIKRADRLSRAKSPPQSAAR